MDTCRECNAPLPAGERGRPKVFCNTTCRQTWNKRRMTRGAELYDFVMAWRFERDTPDMLAQVARLASAYRTADNHARRKSWNAEEAQLRLPLVFCMTTGDGR